MPVSRNPVTHTIDTKLGNTSVLPASQSISTKHRRFCGSGLSVWCRGRLDKLGTGFSPVQPRPALCGCIPTSLHPVFKLQCRYFGKFLDVVGYQHEPLASRVCCNMQIVHAYRLPHHLK